MDIKKDELFDRMMSSQNPYEKMIMKHRFLESINNSMLEYVECGMKILAREKFSKFVKEMQDTKAVDPKDNEKIQEVGSYMSKFMIDAGRFISIAGGVKAVFDYKYDDDFQQQLTEMTALLCIDAYEKYRNGFFESK